MDRLRGGFGPMIVTCALNGGVQGKESSPALPETPEELAVGRGLAHVTGATLTTRAIAEAVRRVLAIHAVLAEAKP